MKKVKLCSALFYIQPNTIDLTLGNNYRVCEVYSPEPRTEV